MVRIHLLARVTSSAAERPVHTGEGPGFDTLVAHQVLLAQR